MPKRTYEISESAGELLGLMKNEKKARFRDRLRLLWFLKTGESDTMTRAAQLCGVTRLTAAEWLSFRCSENQIFLPRSLIFF